jgi:adenylate cyclase class 2
VQEEIESRVEDGDAFMAMFEELGYRPWFRYEKFRTKFQLSKRKPWAKGLVIDLDETPIGTFVELEGPPRAIDRVARELGYSRGDYIVANYLALYREECQRRGEKSGDMVFRKAK